MAMSWLHGGKNGVSAKDRLTDAFDGSDCSSYDIQRKSAQSVKFDKESTADARSLESLEVKTEADSRPDDLNENGHLLDGKDDLNNESLSEILGGIEVKLDPELGALLGDDAEVAAINLGWNTDKIEEHYTEGRGIEVDESQSYSELMSGVKPEEKLEVPLHLALDGVSCQVVCSDKVANIV